MRRKVQLVIAWRSVSVLWGRCPYCGLRGGARLPDEEYAPHIASGTCR